ncbi:ABC transporter ATP-binding protein, partial [Schumannella luteola]
MTISATPDAGARVTPGTGIQITGLSKAFDAGRGRTVQALQDTELHTEQGSFL